MDAETRRMISDLGNSHRDFISAPGASVGVQLRNVPEVNNAHPVHNADGKTADVLAKWNTPSLFDTGDAVNQLEDRCSGQGHRAGLLASLKRDGYYDTRVEARENRYGEERALYLQEREAKGKGNYVASVRSSASAQEGHQPGRSPRTATRDTTGARPRPRALSPRLFGTKRFPPRGATVSSASVPTTNPQDIVGKVSTPPAPPVETADAVEKAAAVSMVDVKPPSTSGAINVTLHSPEGKPLGVRSLHLDAPLQVSLSITAPAGLVGLAELAKMIGDIVLAMGSRAHVVEIMAGVKEVQGLCVVEDDSEDERDGIVKT